MESFSLESLFFVLIPLFFFIIIIFFPIIFSIVPIITRKHSTGFKAYPIVGSLPGFIRNRHRFLEWSTEILKRCPSQTAVFRRPGNLHGVITANPANVEHMLKTNFENYPKGKRFISILEDMLGRGIFNADGQMWKIQRKTASYEFSTKSLRNFVIDNVKLEITSRLIPLLAEAARTEQVIDIQDTLERFAFDNICKLAFNFDPGCLAGNANAGSEFMRAFDTAAALSSGRFMSANINIWKAKKKFGLGSERTLRESIATVHKFADEIIRIKMASKQGNKNDDLLSRFIGTDEMNSPELLRDVVISFMLAGRDTTSSALTWFFWLISSNPNAEGKILDELAAVRSRTLVKKPSSSATFDFEELREMNYLHAAITESLRLYPPVPVDSKSCLNDDVLPDGTFVGKGWFMSYHPYAIGRMESVWGRDCLKFLPERWIEQGVFRQENQFKFPVFHGGPRMCLGKDMAYIQMKSVAAAVLQRFEIDVVKKEEQPQPLLSLTLRIKGGLHVRVRERDDDKSGLV